MVATLAQDLMEGPGTALWRLRGGGATTFLEEEETNKEGGTGVEQVLGNEEDKKEVLCRGLEERTGTLEDRGEDREALEDREDWVGGGVKDRIRAKEDQEGARARIIVTED